MAVTQYVARRGRAIVHAVQYGHDCGPGDNIESLRELCQMPGLSDADLTVDGAAVYFRGRLLADGDWVVNVGNGRVTLVKAVVFERDYEKGKG